MVCDKSFRAVAPAQYEMLSSQEGKEVEWDRASASSSDETLYVAADLQSCSSSSESPLHTYVEDAAESWQMEQNSGCEFECEAACMETDDLIVARSAVLDEPPSLKRVNTWSEYNEDISLEWLREEENSDAQLMLVPMMPLLTPWSIGEDGMELQPQVESGLAHMMMVEDPYIERAILAAQDRTSHEAQLNKKSRGKGNKGKYAEFVAELCEKLKAGKDEQEEAIASLAGYVVQLSFDPAGCRAVQLALNVANVEAASQLAAELNGFILDAVHSPFGNYVVQECVKVLPPDYIFWIIDELRGHTCSVARHRYGCRILCRLVEHATGPLAIVHELLADVGAFIRHEYAHHVIESLLEHGFREQRQEIAYSLCTDLHKNVDNRSAAFVMESALTHCGQAEQAMILERVMSLKPDMLTWIKRGQARLWSHITKASSKLQLEPPAKALSDAAGSKGSKHGKRARGWAKSA